MSNTARPLHVLVLSWNYPTAAAPQRGLWVQRMCHAAAAQARVQVIVPTPWVPPGLPWRALARFRDVPSHWREGAVQVHAPRVAGSIEYHTHALDARLARRRVQALAHALHRESPFDLIHAHFVYPDGVVAAALGQQLGIPVMTSEHAFWRPWLVDQPREGTQVDAALPGLRVVAPVSEFLRADVDAYLAGRARTVVLPNVVDDAVFHPAPAERDPDALLYVGLIRRFKRVDVLIRALALARRQRPLLHLKILSADAFRAYGDDRREVNRLIDELGLREAVSIVHGSSPAAVADAMRRCTAVVVSSTRRETFCSVAAEALACGTPLVTTRCGGPEEFFSEGDGVMVEADDPTALAEGLLRALRERGSFDPQAMHQRIVGRFGRDAWCARAMHLYRQVAAGQAA
jgi:glycosyltransferase involved in cell wall biosynthesis